jgi:hypothetical protein
VGWSGDEQVDLVAGPPPFQRHEPKKQPGRQTVTRRGLGDGDSGGVDHLADGVVGTIVHASADGSLARGGVWIKPGVVTAGGAQSSTTHNTPQP